MPLLFNFDWRYFCNAKSQYIRNALAQAIGTSQYWKVFPDFLITDDVKIMVELCEANWLITEIFLLSRNEKVRKEDFVVWKLALNSTSAVLSADDGNYHEFIRKEIPFTDFPMSEGISLYWCDNVLLLPTEY